MKASIKCITAICMSFLPWVSHATDFSPLNTPDLANVGVIYSKQFYACGTYVDPHAYVKQHCAGILTKDELALGKSIAPDIKARRFICKDVQANTRIPIGFSIFDFKQNDRICLTNGQWRLASHDQVDGEMILSSVKEKTIPIDWKKQCRRTSSNPLAFDQTIYLINKIIKKNIGQDKIAKVLKATIEQSKDSIEESAFIDDMDEAANHISSECHAPSDIVKMAIEVKTAFSRAHGYEQTD